MKISEAFPRRFHRADDVNEPTTLEVVQVLVEHFSNGNKPVVYFAEDEKGLVLNPTTFRQIAEVIGEDDTEHWSGHEITLVREQTVIDGKSTPCIRVRKPKTLLRKK